MKQILTVIIKGQNSINEVATEENISMISFLNQQINMIKDISHFSGQVSSFKYLFDVKWFITLRKILSLYFFPGPCYKQIYNIQWPSNNNNIDHGK